MASSARCFCSTRRTAAPASKHHRHHRSMTLPVDGRMPTKLHQPFVEEALFDTYRIACRMWKAVPEALASAPIHQVTATPTAGISGICKRLVPEFGGEFFLTSMGDTCFSHTVDKSASCSIPRVTLLARECCRCGAGSCAWMWGCPALCSRDLGEICFRLCASCSAVE